MSLKKCPACGTDVSKSAAACPACGHPLKPKQYGCGTLIALGFLLFAVMTLWNSCSDSSSPAYSRSSDQDPVRSAAEQQAEQQEYEQCREVSDQAIKAGVFRGVGGEADGHVIINLGATWQALAYAQQKQLAECLAKSLAGRPGAFKPIVLIDQQTRTVHGKVTYGTFKPQVED